MPEAALTCALPANDAAVFALRSDYQECPLPEAKNFSDRSRTRAAWSEPTTASAAQNPL